MNEKRPTPISRGVEIQKDKVEEIKQWAMARHAEVVELGRIVSQRREQELAKPVEQQDAGKILEFENQDRALDDISNELTDLIMGAFNKEDELRKKWLALEERLGVSNKS